MYRRPTEDTAEGWKQVALNQLQLLDRSLRGILAVDEDGVVLFANEALGRFLGQVEEKMIGRPFTDFLVDREAELFDQILKTVKEGEPDAATKVTLERKARGEWFDVYFKRSKGGDGAIFAYFRNITARVKVEKELRERHTLLNGLIESSVDGIIAADIEGNIILFNPGAQHLLGYTEQEAIQSLHTTRLYVEGTAREIMRKMRSLDWGGQGKCLKHRVVALTKDGDEVPLSLSGSILYDEDGNEIASFGIFTDLRKQELMERQLQEKQMELIQSEKMASLGKLAAGVAHEVNNPLSGILIYASMVLEELPEDSPLRQDIQRVVEETTRCKSIVRELLDFARQEEYSCDVLDVNTVIRDGIHLMRNQSLFQNVEVVMDLADDLPTAYASSVRLNQVFLNLAINAAEAMDGSGTLTIRTRRHTDGDKVRVVFADTGAGIPDDIRSRIFDPFFTTKEVGKGTGLGLSVSYRILRDCGGTIEVDSRIGEGTTFTVDLPLGTPLGEARQSEAS